MTVRALFVGAPSGGHLYPALSVMRALHQRWEVDGLFLTHEGNTERQILGSVASPGNAVVGGSLVSFPRSFARQWRTLRELWERTPWDGCVAFGGRSCFVPALFTVAKRRPLFLHEQNRIVGKTHLWLSRLARRVFLSYSDTIMPRRLQRHALFLGCPVRPEFELEPAPRVAGEAGELRVTVLGGSQGSEDLNRLAVEGLCRFQKGRGRALRVQHVSGSGKQAELAQRYQEGGVEAEVVEYLANPVESFRESHLVLCRGGGAGAAPPT